MAVISASASNKNVVKKDANTMNTNALKSQMLDAVNNAIDQTKKSLSNWIITTSSSSGTPKDSDGKTELTKVTNPKVTNPTTKIKNEVTYIGGGGSGGGSGGGGSGGGGGGGGSSTTKVTTQEYADDGTFPIPPQAFYVYDKGSKKTYKFDGVVKVSHTLSLKVEEEPSEEKAAQYVNNAKNEPDKVVFDVMMSEVYTTRNDLTKHDSIRSRSALSVLYEIKHERMLVDVVTNMRTYSDMLLSGVSITQDADTTHFGWYGQLTFTEKPEAIVGGGGGGGETTGRASSTSNARTPSLLANIFGTLI